MFGWLLASMLNESLYLFDNLSETLFHLNFRALSNTLSDFEFNAVQFDEYVQPTFSALFTLLKEAVECETKMSVLNVMSTVVDKMDDRLAKDAESLCHYLPMLWNESQDHAMLRCAILSTLVSHNE